MMTKAAAIVVLTLSFVSFVGWLSGLNQPDFVAGQAPLADLNERGAP